MEHQKNPFNPELQNKLIKLSLTDATFLSLASEHVTPDILDSEALRWCWGEIQSERRDGRFATLSILRNNLRKLEPNERKRFSPALDSVEQCDLREEAYIRYELADFIRYKAFAKGYVSVSELWNRGQQDKAIALMRQVVNTAEQITFEAPERYWFYEELDERQLIREHKADNSIEDTHPTGVKMVDWVLNGGLSRGEVGAWIGLSKAGKSIFLNQLACFTARVRRNVLFVVLEGYKDQIMDRLDAFHAKSSYKSIKWGEFGSDTHGRQVLQRLKMEYMAHRRRMVVVPLLKKRATLDDIRRHLDQLKMQDGWAPDQIVVDYGDLMRARFNARSEEEHQHAAFSDLKLLAAQDNGYSVWTATQARRYKDPNVNRMRGPVSGLEVLTEKDIAESYNKVRRLDFLGSINRTDQDVISKQVRLYVAIYRDNEAHKEVILDQSLDKMQFVKIDSPRNVRGQIPVQEDPMQNAEEDNPTIEPVSILEAKKTRKSKKK